MCGDYRFSWVVKLDNGSSKFEYSFEGRFVEVRDFTVEKIKEVMYWLFRNEEGKVKWEVSHDDMSGALFSLSMGEEYIGSVERQYGILREEE